MHNDQRGDTSEELQGGAPAAGSVVTVPQQGGAIALRDGVAINSLSVQEAALRSLAAVGDGLPWLAVLVHSAVTSAPGGKAQILTDWGPGTENENPEKYAAYVAYLRDVIGRECPYVWPLLDAAGALVQVGQGKFSFCTSTHLGISFDAPQLYLYTYLTPFAVDDGDEVAH